MKEKYGVIYKITNKINNKVYIGQTTSDFNRRYGCSDDAFQTHNKHLNNSIRKYGIENFEIDKEYKIAYSKEELDKLEIELINKYNSLDARFGYNKKSGGANGKPTSETIEKLRKSHTGYVMPKEQRMKISNALKGEKSYMYGVEKSPEIRRKISESLKGRIPPKEEIERSRLARIGIKLSDTTRKNISESLKEYYRTHTHHMKGKSLTEEHKRKVSESRKGMKFSEEHCKNIGNSKRGFIHSEETKRRMSESRKGRKFADDHKMKITISNSMPVRCVTTDKVFLNAKEGAKYYGMKSKSVINLCCNGKQKTAGKLPDGTRLVWEYIDKEKYVNDNTEVINQITKG